MKGCIPLILAAAVLAAGGCGGEKTGPPEGTVVHAVRTISVETKKPVVVYYHYRTDCPNLKAQWHAPTGETPVLITLTYRNGRFIDSEGAAWSPQPCARCVRK